MEDEDELYFDYVINPTKQSRICFGTTLHRTTMPMYGPGLSPLMRRLTAYPMDVTCAQSPLVTHCCCATAKTGYGPMASKVPRFIRPTIDKSPSINTAAITSAKPVRQCARPFGRSMHDREIAPTTPGPGTYTLRKRNYVFKCSFGGRRRLIPAVVCQPAPVDVCTVCRGRPVGIYWKNFRLNRIMCRYCKPGKQVEAKHSNVVRQMEMNEYKRVRCCDVRIGARALHNQLKIENYLSMFGM